jgi:hypothetical protein
MVSSAHLQGTSLIMYLIGQYQGKVQIVAGCGYACFFFEDYNSAVFEGEP